MTQPRVYLDSDLRRLSSYELARSMPLSSQIALSSSGLPLRFDQASIFYGISSSPFVSAVSSYELARSIQRSLSAVSYDHRLCHVAGPSDDVHITDLRPSAPNPSNNPYPAVGAKAEGRSGRGTSSARTATTAGAEGLPEGVPGAAAGLRPLQSDAAGIGLEEVE